MKLKDKDSPILSKVMRMEERKKSNDSSVRKSNQVKLHDGEKMALRGKPHHDEGKKGTQKKATLRHF